MRKYTRKIRQGQFGHKLIELQEQFDETLWKWHTALPALHWFVESKIDYCKTGDKVHSAKETLRKGEGDCQDQTVLLANLLLDCGHHVKIVDLSHINESRGHVLPLVRTHCLTSDHSSKLQDSYMNMFGQNIGDVSYQEPGAAKYLVADPEWSDHIGDVESLKGDYVRDKFNGWEFASVKDDVLVESDGETTEVEQFKKKMIRRDNRANA